MPVSNDREQATQSVEEYIRRARAVLKPSPVRLHHIPPWLTKRLRAAVKAGGLQVNLRRMASGGYLLEEATRGTDDSWLDHYGSTPDGKGGLYFVSEPYGFDEAAVRRFAEMLGLEWGLSPNSWWYPGCTFRIVFYEPDSQSWEETPPDEVA